MSIVLDASAVLALLRDEPGADRVRTHLLNGVISTVNYAEVVGHYARLGAEPEDVRMMLAPLSLTTIPLDEAVALAAGLMRSVGDRAGLSLGDRVCLALAKTRGAAALTADRAWQSIDVGVEVDLIR